MISHDDHTHDHNRQSMIKVAILIGLGAYFAYNIISGNLANYINARFAWLSYLAAALFFLLAIVALWTRRHHDHAHDDHDHHDHNHSASWWMLLIVALPLLMGALIPSYPLGADAITGEIRTSAVSVNTSSAPATDPGEWNILDWLRQFGHSTNLGAFNGQEASVIGFIYREPDFPADHFMVVRLTVSCCVADSSAIGLPVYSDAGLDATIADGEWVRVDGAFEVGEFQDEAIPILQLTGIEVVQQPAQPYLNP